MPQSAEVPAQKKHKALSVLVQIIHKLLGVYGPQHWPTAELEQMLNDSAKGHNKALQTTVQQVSSSAYTF